jgi:hypothetical protein
MTTDRTFAAYWRGRDSIAGDVCPYAKDTPEARAWEHGYWTMMAEDDPSLRTPMSTDEVTRRFAELNRKA